MRQPVRPATSSFQLTRRRIAFWIGFGLFSLGERLNAGGLDRLAAAAMRAAEPANRPAPANNAMPTHWKPADNRTWRWFERESFVDGKWKLTGITTPVHKETGQRYAGAAGYLDDSLVPAEVGRGSVAIPANDEADADADETVRRPHPTRRARHGRPPSQWLRSLTADEIRIWLKTIEVPEVGVDGMTFWTHLTRDHSFDAEKIKGLTETEQAKLHAAAHYGY